MQSVEVPFNPPLKVGVDKEYTGGIGDEQFHRLQTEAGREGIHTPTWGKNAADYNVEEALPRWHDVNAGLIGHEYRGQIQEIDEVLEPLAEQAAKAEQEAFSAIEAHGDLELEREGLHLRMAREGLEPPSDRRDWGLGAKLGGLVIADLGLLSVAYQVLDLSDKQFLGVPYLSENALAASGAVLSVVLLAHLAGQQIRRGVNHMTLAADDRTTNGKEK
jgi:hypothetical protein